MKLCKKTLAVFLSVLMTLSMCSVLGTVAFAEGEFALLPTADSDAFADGDYWFCLDDLLGTAQVYWDYSEESLDFLRNTLYYLSVDASGRTLKLVRPDDLTLTYKESESGTDIYFNCLRQHGVAQFPDYHTVPTADSEDLTDVDYWFDLEGYISALDYDETTADLYRNQGEFYLKNDGSKFLIKIYALLAENDVSNPFF